MAEYKRPKHKAEHTDNCVYDHYNCPCISCKNDNPTCCVELGFHFCIDGGKCKYYEKEEVPDV